MDANSNPNAWRLTRTREEDNQLPEFELPPVGVYTFELVNKDPDEKQKPEYDPTGTKYRSRFHFKIVDDEDWEDTVIKVFYNLTLNDQGYFLPVVEALLGRTLGPTELVGFEDDPAGNVTGLKGLRMQATLKHDVKQDGKVYPRLESPFPVRPKGTGRRKAAPAAPPAESSGDVPF